MKIRKLRYPDFVCIGAQKSGTTWLHYVLSQHPEVWMPQVKELQFFNQLHIPSHSGWIPRHRDEHATRALRNLAKRLEGNKGADWERVSELVQLAGFQVSDEWYGKLFAFAGAEQKAGEFTPEYALLPEDGIKHLFQLSPSAKIIFLVRDPIDRAWSHMRMLVSHSARNPTESDLVSMSQLADVVDRCDYAETMRRWLSVAPPEQFLLLNYDDIHDSPNRLLAKVCGFLHIAEMDLPGSVLNRVVHEGAPVERPASVYQALKDRLKPLYMDPPAALAEAFAPWRARHYPN